MSETITYSDAIELVMKNNGNFAPLKLIYQEIWKYKDRTKIKGLTPDMTIQERVQRDTRFTRIAKGVYALTSFLEMVENDNLGYFAFNDKDEIIFKSTFVDPAKFFYNTESLVLQKVRKGQSYFRKLLLNEMHKCPITGIDDERILLASHIKPWVYSNNEERINPKNGLLLSPLYDKLFDKGIGLITFTLDKEMLISTKLSKDNQLRMNLENKKIIVNLDIEGREEFLEYHRQYIFQG